MGTVDQMPLRAVAVVLAMLATAGCLGGSKEEPIPVPAGFQEYATPDYGFAYPVGWQREEEKDEHGRTALNVIGPELAEGVRDGHVHVQRYADYPQDFGTALSQFRGLARMNGYALTVNRRIMVGGAVRAHRFEATYDLEGDEGRRVPFSLVGMYAMTEDGDLVEFMVRAPRQQQSAARASAIFGSFRLRGR